MTVLGEPASLMGIAVIHSVFNVLCTMLMLPLASLLEALVCKIVPDAKKPEEPAAISLRLPSF